MRPVDSANLRQRKMRTEVRFCCLVMYEKSTYFQRYSCPHFAGKLLVARCRSRLEVRSFIALGSKSRRADELAKAAAEAEAKEREERKRHKEAPAYGTQATL